LSFSLLTPLPSLLSSLLTSPEPKTPGSHLFVFVPLPSCTQTATAFIRLCLLPAPPPAPPRPSPFFG